MSQQSGNLSIAVITWLMNSFIEMESIPQKYKYGLLVPIPKQNKDHTIKDNNRGITLLTVLYKLFESMLLQRESCWLRDPAVTNDLQGAGQEKGSCLHTSMLVQEAIAHNVNKGNTVYVAFLDTRKAFDTVWINGMLYQLHKAGVSMKTWRLIKDAYTNFRCAVSLGGQHGEWFTPERGVHQGAPFSMRLYQIFLNDLLCQLRSHCYRIKIGNIDVTCRRQLVIYPL